MSFANFGFFPDFWVSCHFGSSQLLVLCKFYKTNTDFDKLLLLPETSVNQDHKTLPSLKMAKSTEIKISKLDESFNVKSL